MLLLVAVLLIIMLLLVILIRRRRTTATETDTEDEKLVKPDCISDDVTNEPPDPESDCFYKPKNGTCLLKDTILKDGCCVLNLPPEMTDTEMYLRMGVGNAIMTQVGKAGDSIILSPVSLFKSISARATSKTASKSTLGKFITKLCQKIAARQSTRMFLKLQAKMAKGANAATTAAAVLDIADPYGYSTFVSNKYLADMRDTVEYYVQVQTEEEGSRYPIMFDIQWMYGDIYDKAYVKYISTFTTDAMNEIFGCTGEQITQKTVDDKYVDIVVLAIEMANKDPIKRDTYVYKKIKYDNPNEAKYIDMYPEYSTETDTGISINQEGVKLWNTFTDEMIREKLRKSTRLGTKIYDTDEIVNSFLSYFKNMIVAFTKNYRKHHMGDGCREPHKEIIDHIMNFGTEFLSKINPDMKNECVPRMRAEELTKPIPMMLSATIYNFCKVGGPKLVPDVPECESADPTDFNVGFNDNTNLCIYNREYCDRMALDYNSTTQDCDWYPGQEGMELFFPTGTTVTRNVMRYATSIKNCDDPEYAAQYANDHDCRVQNIFGINKAVDKANAIGECGENWADSGYRSKEACEFARTGSVVTAVMPFAGAIGGDCGEAVFKAAVNEAYDAGEGFKDLFEGDTSYFEEKGEEQVERMENRANAVKDIFTGEATEQSFITAITGVEDGPADEVALSMLKNTRQYKSGKAKYDFVTGDADYEDPFMYFSLLSPW